MPTSFLYRVLVGVFACLLTSAATATPGDDLALIKQRLRTRYLAEWAPGSAAMEVEVPEPVDALLSQLKTDGSWANIDYSVPATVGQVGFPAFPHVARMRKLAAAYANSTGKDRLVLSAAIHRVLAFWIKADPQTGHHWFVEIGAPIELGKTAIMFEEELTAEERAGVVRLMEVSRRPDGTLYYATKPATGQNLIWESTLQIVAGCLKGDAGYAAQYARRAEQEIKPIGVEGVQVDWSFHQHGPQLSSAAYGVGFVNDCARLIAVLQGTAFQFSPATTDMVTGCVLDGDQRMIRGHTWDFSPTARNIVWPRIDASEILPACDELAQLGGSRSEEFKAMARRLRGQAPASSAPAGNRLYWTSDYMTHVRADFYASVKMSSLRTYGNESGNGQGEKTSYHLGDGAFCLMLDGEEYRGIFPLWDWRLVPGVTCVYPADPQPPLPANIWGKGSEGGSDFAGGVSDGSIGVAAMELNRGGAKAKKAWFFLDDSIVSLGTGIEAQDRQSQLLTSVNQTWARSEVLIDRSAVSFTSGKTLAVKNPGWVYHNHVAYVFPTGGELRMRKDSRKAVWQEINTLTKIKPPAAGDVFSLWIEHAKGEENAHYAYVVLPGVDPANVDQAITARLPHILANTGESQVISSAAGDVVQAVFWQSGETALPDGRVLSVDGPCALLLRRSLTGWTITAGNPTQKAMSLHVSLRGKSADLSAVHDLIFTFSEGAYAGRSISQEIAN